MEAIQLSDRFTEEVIGFVLLDGEVSLDAIRDAWNKYSDVYSSNSKDGDVYAFVDMFPDMNLKVINMNYTYNF